jgi:branched-chain amino acid transport system substrate-binding protein
MIKISKITTLLATTAIAVAGCAPAASSSVSSQPGTSSSVVTESVSQGVTATTVTVGNCAATSGAFAGVGQPFNAAINAYFDMVNAAGGIQGRQIRFMHEDDGFNPAIGLACTEKMVEDNKVFAMVGHFGTPTVGATLNYLKEKGVPTTYLATGISQLYFERASDFDKVIFPVQPIFDMEGRIMVARAIKSLGIGPGISRVAVMYTSDDAGLSMLKGIRQEAATQGVTLSLHQFSTTDVSGVVTGVLGQRPNAIIVAANQIPFRTAAIALANQNNTVPVYTSYVSADIVTVNTIKDAVGSKFDVYANAWVDITARAGAYEKFATEIAKKNTPALNNLQVNAFAFAGWIAADLFVEGLRRVAAENKVLNWNNYMLALESKPYENPFGGNIDFSRGQRLGTQQMALLKMNPAEALGWANADNLGLQGIQDLLG